MQSFFKKNQATSQPQKNHGTSRSRKKITQPLGPKIDNATSWPGKRIMQPVGPEKKYHATSQLREKKSRNLRAQKNHTTLSGRQKKLQKPLAMKKSHATTRHKKKIIQPLGTKKKNYATSWHKRKKSRLRETLNLSTDADSRTDTILERLHDLSQKKSRTRDTPTLSTDAYSRTDLSRKKEKKWGGLRVHALALRVGNGRSAPTPRF